MSRKLTDVELVMKSHRVSREEAERIIKDIESGKRQVISADKLVEKAGVVRRSDLRKSTRPLARLFGEGLESLDLPPRGRGRRDNGASPQLGDVSARGLG